MKKPILFLAVFFYAAMFVTAQTYEWKCGTMEYLEKQKKENPNLESQMLIQEEQIQQWIKQNYNSKSNENKLQSGTITIPVVVHILYNSSDQNYTDEQVIEQINMSNRDFAGLNTHSMILFDLGLKANTGIQFCLISKKPNGDTTNGIERRQISKTSFTANDDMKFYSKGGLDAWDPKLYFNIWVCNLSDYGGYAQFPGTGINSTFGAVVDYQRFGPGGIPGYNNGGITTHEIGHCVNLRHTWADDNGACTGTDYCDDVPNQANYIRGFHDQPLYDSCSPNPPGIMYMNFMDYSDDATYANFTPDQTARIQACFATPSGPLLPLLISTACSAPAWCETPTSLKTIATSRYVAVLEWADMINAVKFNIRYRKIGAANWSTATSTSNTITLSGLTKNSSYEFQVQTDCGGGISDFSYSCSFKTSNQEQPTYLAQPNLVSPANNAINVSVNQVLTWNSVSGANSYIFQYSMTSDFSDVIENVISTTSRTLYGLYYNKTYYWRVKAKYNDLTSIWSAARNFTTEDGTIAAPVLYYPTNGATGVASSPVLYWNAVSGASEYNLQYSKSSTFVPPTEVTNIIGTKVTISGISNNTTYYWRVNSFDGLNTSVWSNVFKFKTSRNGKQANEDDTDISINQSILNCFPNPASGSISINYAISEPGVIIFTITNSLGIEIERINDNQTQEPGYYSINYDVSNLITGVYYLTMRAGNNIETKKFVVVR